MFSNIGMPGLILILVLALVIFGPSKLPELGRAVGKTLREFKTAARDVSSDHERDNDAAAKKTPDQEAK